MTDRPDLDCEAAAASGNAGLPELGGIGSIDVLGTLQAVVERRRSRRSPARVRPQSVNHLRGSLRRAFNLARRMEKFPRANPATDVPKRKVPKRLPDDLPPFWGSTPVAADPSTRHSRSCPGLICSRRTAYEPTVRKLADLP
jgi:hypothetical protein